MAYTTIRGRTTRINNSLPPQPTGPSFRRIGEVTTVVGAPVDFGSWLKNLAQIREKPSDLNSWVGFGTDTLKLLNAAKELALKSPLFPKTGALVELVNKADKIVGDFNSGNGVQLSDAIGIFGEALGIASEIKLFPLPVQLGLKAGGIGLSAVAQIDSLGNYRIGASEPLPASRFTVGYDFYNSSGGAGLQVVETARDNETGRIVVRHYDSSSKLVMTVTELADNKFEVLIPGNPVPSILNGINPLGNDLLQQRFGPPAKGGLSNPSGLSGQLSDALDYLLDETINAELTEQFPSVDTDSIDYAVLDSENAVAWSNLDDVALEAGHLLGDTVNINLQQGSDQIVFVASIDAPLSDAGNGLFAPIIESINGQPLTAFNHGIDPQDLEAYGFTWQNLTSGELPDSAVAVISGLNPATLAAAGQPTPQILQTPIRDANGQIIGYERALELANGTTLTTITNTSGTPTQLLETRTEGNQVTTTTYALDSAGSRTGQFLTQGIYSSNGAFSGQRTDLRTNTVYDIAIEPDGTETLTVNTSATEQVINQATTTALNDISGLISAIQGGRPLPILNSGLVLANNLVNPTTGGTYIVNNAGLSTVTGVVGGLASLYNLSNALQNGDTLTQINASLSTLNYVNRTLPRLLDNAGPFNPALDGFLNGTAGANGQLGLINGGTPGVLPVIGLILSIRSGDPIGITSGIIGIVNPALLAGPVGWILAGFSILKALFDEPPEAWGVAKFVFDDNGQLQIDVVGEAFGTDRVRSQLQQTQQVLQAMIAQAQIAAPDTALGIIPQRTASITWREVRQSDKGYAINDIDPITGQQRYPFLRWDDNGVPFSSNPAVWQPDPTDPNIRVAMTEQLIASALRREAIAPLWEVNTAKMQQDSGDSLAGLTEAERAARLGLGATYDANNKPVGQFRPVTLDLDGNGTITTVGKDDETNTVGFDWDDSGFNKQVSWVKPNDGFLFLDRDSNGVVSSGRELFSNSEVSDNYKGIRSIEWIDGNRDGKINHLDPAYSQIKIWQDANQDGDSFTALPNGAIVVDLNEIKTLSELGITEVDYINARFVRNGNLFAMKSDQLQADENGTRVTQTPNGISIEYSNGAQQFIITQVTSLAGGADRIDGLYEDGDPFGQPRATPIEIVIPVSLFIAENSSAFTINTIALCAGSMPGTGSKGLENTHYNCVHRTRRRNTAIRIALCAGSMPGRGRKRFIKYCEIKRPVMIAVNPVAEKS